MRGKRQHGGRKKEPERIRKRRREIMERAARRKRRRMRREEGEQQGEGAGNAPRTQFGRCPFCVLKIIAPHRIIIEMQREGKGKVNERGESSGKGGKGGRKGSKCGETNHRRARTESPN